MFHTLFELFLWLLFATCLVLAGFLGAALLVALPATRFAWVGVCAAGFFFPVKIDFLVALDKDAFFTYT